MPFPDGDAPAYRPSYLFGTAEGALYDVPSRSASLERGMGPWLIRWHHCGEGVLQACSTIGCSGGTGIGHETHIAPAITGTIMTTIDGYNWTTASSGGGSGPNAVDLNAGPGTHIGADRMSVRVGDEFGVRVELYAQSYWSSSDTGEIFEEYAYWVGTAGEADFSCTVTLSEVELEDASGDLIARFQIEWSDGEVTLPEPRAAIPWAIFTLLALRAQRCRC